MEGTPSRDLRLMRAAAELWDQDDQEIGFLARLFTQTSLPYRDPGDKPRWERRNGDLTLSVRPGSTGYPYGAMPRLLLNWLSTEALRTNSRDLILGRNLSDFMRQLGLTPTGGKNGTITRLMKQSDRLFQASLAVRWVGENRVAGGQMNVASEYNLWSTPGDDPDAQTLFPSIVRLSGDFFDEVTNHPVPIDLGALRALRGSALRLDIYCWLTYRMSYLRRPSTVSWETLRAQFGSELAETKQGRGQFRRDFAKHLREVLLIYREANVEVTNAGVELSPSRTHVPFKGLRDLARAPTQARVGAAESAAARPDGILPSECAGLLRS